MSVLERLNELYPTWEKVHLTKAGYIQQRQDTIFQLLAYIEELMEEKN
jgi:hypothetical protein